jgi:structural maintenance of chromosome 2
LTEKQVQYEKCVSTVLELEQTIKTYGTEREGRLKALEKRIKSLKSEMQTMSKQLKVAYFLIVTTTGLSLNL